MPMVPTVVAEKKKNATVQQEKMANVLKSLRVNIK